MRISHTGFPERPADGPRQSAEGALTASILPPGGQEEVLDLADLLRLQCDGAEEGLGLPSQAAISNAPNAGAHLRRNFRSHHLFYAAAAKRATRAGGGEKRPFVQPALFPPDHSLKARPRARRERDADIPLTVSRPLSPLTSVPFWLAGNVISNSSSYFFLPRI